MTTALLTRTDVRLRDAVVRQLEWDPEVDASAIGVAAKDGVVTLTGFIDTYTGKLAAERVAKGTRGVRAVANDIAVKLGAGRTDSDIATDAARALGLRPSVPDSVQAVVHNGHITLTGTVEWFYQKEQAESAVKHVRGIVGVFNHIFVNPTAGLRDVHRRIVQALHHSAEIDSRHVQVTAADDVVTLRGTVGTWMQRDAAERAAKSAPGIRRVVNELRVEADELSDDEMLDEIC